MSEISSCFNGDNLKYMEKVIKGYEVEGTPNFWCNYIGKCKYKDIIGKWMYCYHKEFEGLESYLFENGEEDSP